MIAPKTHDKKKSNVLALVVTVVSCALLYGLLIGVGFPEAVSQPQDVFKQVQFELLPRFTPTPEAGVDAAEDVIEEIEEAEVEETAEEVAPKVAETVSTPQKVQLDLDALTPPGFETELAPSNPDPTRDRALGSSGSKAPQRLALDAGTDLGGIETLKGLESPSMSNAKRRVGTAGGGNGGGLKLAMEEGSGLSEGESGIGGDLLGGGDVLGGPKGREGVAEGITAVEVGLQDITSFGEDYESLDFKALVEWMKKNPADLPIAVKQRMQRGNWDESLLSSRVGITIGNRAFDLLLMCKEDLYEVHIMLVETREVTYLIDRSFRQQSTQLVTGNVTLGGDQDIQVVSSRMRPASDERNEEFYAIFLSWWEKIEGGV